MRTVVVVDGQTMADIAIQEFGSLEAVGDMARVNGIPVTGTLIDGEVLKLPDNEYNAKMRKFCALNAVKPATEQENGGKGVFGTEFSNEFI